MAARLLGHFLGGSGSPFAIYLSEGSSFVNDPGITRATRAVGPPQNRHDEADEIIPLLTVFAEDFVKPALRAAPTSMRIRNVEVKGEPLYFDDPAFTAILDGVRLGVEPRAHDEGWWAAFAHVTIDGTFSATGACVRNGYVVNYRARYRIEDNYAWFPNKFTPLPLPGRTGDVLVPHEWALSLIAAGRAKSFDFTVQWLEQKKLAFNEDLSVYRIVEPHEVILGVPFD
jgi:hypothetical protein